MAYQPHRPDRQQRDWMFRFIWIGAASALAALATELFVPGWAMPGPMIGFAIGGVLGAAIGNQADDYYRALTTMGLRFLAVFVAVYALLGWIEREATLLAPGGRLLDGYFVSLCALLSFYCGYAFAWLRDRF